MSVEKEVAAHYTSGTLLSRILEALKGAGVDVERLAPDDLAPVEEFHLGGRAATIELVSQLGLEPGMRLLDVGSGIGGAARHMAHAEGCRVVGIDLTPEFVAVANELARRVGLADRVSYREGSALALDVPPASFDAATMLHVGMNIEDKAGVFAEVRKALKPGGSFGVYDIMRTGEGGPTFPVPWSSRPETSFLAAPASYRRALEGAGFAVIKERDRRGFALDFLREMKAKSDAAKAAGKPFLSNVVIMGPDFPQKMAHVREAVERGVIAPYEMIARAV
jgi:ubiquinone/menaquinone biosynthesis C-methylase UbiE